MSDKGTFANQPYGKVAWTQPYTICFSSTNTTGFFIPVPFKYYRLRSVMLTVAAYTASGTDTFDLQGWDISAGSANADMFTFTPETIVASKTYVLHVEASQSGAFVSGTSDFAVDSGNQIVAKEGNLFSTVNDTDIIAENRGMLPYITYGATAPTAITMNVVAAIDPVAAL